jgi:hypothetical protein
MIIHYIGAKMKISKKLEKLKDIKTEIANELKTETTGLKLDNDESLKEQEAMLNIWTDIHNQIEEMELMIESLAIMGR